MHLEGRPMSATNVLIQSDRVHLMTDGAIYQPDGTLTAIGPKVRVMPHLNCAVAMRGAYLGLAPIMEEISNAASSFDLLKENMPELLRACAAGYAHLLTQCAAGPEFEIVVVGISESVGPAAYLIPSHDRYGEPWRAMDLAGFVVLPCDKAILASVQAIVAGRIADRLDTAVDGLAIMEAQRAKPALDSGDTCWVGGFAQLTTVTADSVTSRIIHRWPDEIGALIAAPPGAKRMAADDDMQRLGGETNGK